MLFGSSARAIAFVYVADRARGVAFYRDTLGLELVESDDYGDLFASGDARVRMTAMADHRPGPHPVLGWDVADLGEAADALVAKGVELLIYPGFGQDERGIWTAPDGSQLAWFSDPDGNVLMLSRG